MGEYRRYALGSSHLRPPSFRRIHANGCLHARRFPGEGCDTAGVSDADAVATHLYSFLGSYPLVAGSVSPDAERYSADDIAMRGFRRSLFFERPSRLGVHRRDLLTSAILQYQPVWDIHITSRRCAASDGWLTPSRGPESLVPSLNSPESLVPSPNSPKSQVPSPKSLVSSPESRVPSPRLTRKAPRPLELGTRD